MLLLSLIAVNAQITIMDHRGCARKGSEYKGAASGDQDDEMCIVVKQTQLKIDSPAFKELAESVRAVSLQRLHVCLAY